MGSYSGQFGPHTVKVIDLFANCPASTHEWPAASQLKLKRSEAMATSIHGKQPLS